MRWGSIGVCVRLVLGRCQRDRRGRGIDARGVEDAGAPELGEDALRVVLRLLDVRLIERIDLEHAPGDGDGELPAEELTAEVIRVIEVERDDRLAFAEEGRSEE